MADETDSHPVDRYLARDPDTEANAKVKREQTFEALHQLGQYFTGDLNKTPSLNEITDLSDALSDGLEAYLYAHGRLDHLGDGIPFQLVKLAERARKHVDKGGEFSLDNALGIIKPKFKGPGIKEPGEHTHRHLFLMAFYDCEIAPEEMSQIDALRQAAKHDGTPVNDEKYLDEEYRKWRNKNFDWLFWMFATEIL
jgi:hypothetical protein